jgi:hypothetical protein
MHTAVMLMPATEAAQGVCQRAGFRFHALKRLDEFIYCYHLSVLLSRRIGLIRAV